jgi:hypothetical protein
LPRVEEPHRGPRHPNVSDALSAAAFALFDEADEEESGRETYERCVIARLRAKR